MGTTWLRLGHPQTGLVSRRLWVQRVPVSMARNNSQNNQQNQNQNQAHKYCFRARSAADENGGASWVRFAYEDTDGGHCHAVILD